MPLPRRFDHDEARRRYAAGESVVALASAYGVSTKAIYRVINPDRYKATEARARAAYYNRRRVPCEGCGRPTLSMAVAAKRIHTPDGRALCRRCRADEKIERLSFDVTTGALVAVRCSSIDCANGERWQHPENFTNGRRYRDIRPGGIHVSCRACQTRARRSYRQKRKIPCTACGTLVLHERRDMTKPPECRTCANRRTATARLTGSQSRARAAA